MRDGDVLDNNPQVSRSALEAIHDQVFGWALSRCDYNHSVAEDLVQQAYLELLTGKARFDGHSTLKTFVFGVVQNLSRSRYRKLATRLRLIGRVRREHANDYAEMPVLRNSAIWREVQALPQRQRDIVELVFCRDMTIVEACTVMGVTAGTGRQHYERAKKALRQKLGEDARHEIG